VVLLFIFYKSRKRRCTVLHYKQLDRSVVERYVLI